MFTAGSSTVSVTVRRCSWVSTGIATCGSGTSGPRGMEPKYFSISALVAAMSMFPTMARLALLGT